MLNYLKTVFIVARTTQINELETLLTQNKDKVEQMKVERTDLIAKVCRNAYLIVTKFKKKQILTICYCYDHPS